MENESCIKKIRKLLENKIFNLILIEDRLSLDEKAVLDRLRKVYELFDENGTDIFKYIPMDLSYGILRDIGIEEHEINNCYISLMKDAVITKKYVLIDPNNIS